MSLKVNQLTKSFGPNKAVDEVSFEIENPSVVGFLGPNGAGKTTTMRIITGYLSPSSGTVEIDNTRMTSENAELRANIGYLPESNPLYTELEVHEYLKFAAQLSGMNGAQAVQRLGYVVDRCGLKDVLYEPIFHLSKGFKQRVGLAQAIIHDPKMLILDEPTSGLDPNQVVGIRSLISELAQEKLVVLSTHILSEVQSLCSRVLIINAGKLVLDAKSDDLEHTGTDNVKIVVKSAAPIEAVKETFESEFHPLKLISDTEDGAFSLQLSIRDSAGLRERIFDVCVSRGYKILALTKSGSDLEKVFRELTVGSDEKGQ